MTDSAPIDPTMVESGIVPNGGDIEMKEEQSPYSAAAPASLPPQFSVIPPSASQTPLQPQPTPTPIAMAPARSSPHPGVTTQNATPAPPSQPNPHGSPTRVYLNQNVTPHLLEAMKHLAVHEPEKPLKWLAEFLSQRSAEVEGP